MHRPSAAPRPRICFVALGAGPLLDPSVPGATGGMETRAWMIARELVRRMGREVSFVVQDQGQRPVQRRAAMTVRVRTKAVRTELSEQVRSVCSSRQGRDATAPAGWQNGYLSLAWRLPLRFSRALFRNVRQILAGGASGGALYSRIPADVFVTFGVNEISAEVVASCRKMGRKSVVCVASDVDLDEVLMTPTRNQRGDGVRGIEGHFVLTNTDEIIVQSHHQLRLLRERFGRTGHLIPNPIDLNADDTEGKDLEPDVAAIIARGPFVLWVGRSDPVYKRPDCCFELAQKLPHIRFVVVMAPMDARFHADLKGRKPANVDVIDGLPFRAMPHLFRAGLVLVNTSVFEGFPNTFLQAGKYGVPVVSLSVDPDGMLAGQNAGIVCNGNLDRMAARVAELMMNPALRQEYASRLAEHVARHHDLQTCCNTICRVIDRTATDRDEPRTSGSPPAAVIGSRQNPSATRTAA